MDAFCNINNNITLYKIVVTAYAENDNIGFVDSNINNSFSKKDKESAKKDFVLACSNVKEYFSLLNKKYIYINIEMREYKCSQNKNLKDSSFENVVFLKTFDRN